MLSLWYILLIFFLSASILNIEQAHSNSDVRIVGSTAVFPFSALVAERLSLLLDSETPIIERTGTGAGVQLFCGGLGPRFPDVVNTSRRLNPSERKTCTQHGVKDIFEIKIGYGGIVLAQINNQSLLSSFSTPPLFSSLTLEDLFKALSKEIEYNGKWIPNPYKTWADVNSSLPNIPITVFGPPSTSGIRDSIKELILEPFCKMNNPQNCGLLREDGAYIELPENTMLIVQKLETNPGAIGIIGYPFLDQNPDILKAIPINNIIPSITTILEGFYPLSRPLYFYIKIKNLQKKQVLKTFIHEFLDDAVWGNDGALSEKGLIPLSEEERVILRERIQEILYSDFYTFRFSNSAA